MGSVDDVVLVDDDPMVAEFVRRVLRRSTLTLRDFTDPALALEHLRGHGARLLVVDTRMPAMSGPELLARLQDEGRLEGTRVFLCSAGRMMASETSTPLPPHERLMKDDLFDRHTLLDRLAFLSSEVPPLPVAAHRYPSSAADSSGSISNRSPTSP